MRSASSRPRSHKRSPERRPTGVAYSLEAGEPAPRVTLPALFVTFMKISLIGFGGPIVWARRFLVENRRWLDDQEFAEILGLCQFLPGPNVVCITVCIGSKFRGPAGALAAVAGCILIPWTVGFALGAIYLHYTHIPVVQNVMR